MPKQNLDEGCTAYLKAVAHFNFPQGYAVCDFCPCLETYARKQCRLTGEYLAATNKTVGYECPLEFKEETNNETN